MRRVLIQITLLLSLSSVFSESCVDEDSGQKGECVTIKNCESLRYGSSNPRSLQICNREERTICCSEYDGLTTTTARPSRISDKKCGEYAKNIFHEVTFINHRGKTITKVTNQCRRRSSNELLLKAHKKEFPHMAMIGYGNGHFKDYKCSGSLISERWVLSAAHCSIDQELGEAKYIVLGGIKKLKMKPNTKIFNVVRNIPHPSYEDKKIEHDIALYEMNESVTLNTFILPTCLPQSNDNPNKAIETGWTTEYVNRKNSVLIKNSRNHYFPMTTCQKEFNENDDFLNSDFSNMICAGFIHESLVSCQDNSGFQLQYHNRDHYCMYTLCGIVAHGSAYCGKSIGSGAIYTNVFKYLDWIENIVWPGE